MIKEPINVQPEKRFKKKKKKHLSSGLMGLKLFLFIYFNAVVFKFK